MVSRPHGGAADRRGGSLPLAPARPEASLPDCAGVPGGQDPSFRPFTHALAENAPWPKNVKVT